MRGYASTDTPVLNPALTVKLVKLFVYNLWMPFRRDEKALEEEAEEEVEELRKKSGRSVGRQAQIIAVPMWTLDQSSVWEYEGMRLPGM